MESMNLSEISDFGGRPIADGLHRKLGITLEGMYFFLEEIGFIEWEYPDLWPSKWVERRGDPRQTQRGGYEIILNDRRCKCKECNGVIYPEENIYSGNNERTRHLSEARRNENRGEMRLDRYHIACFSKKVQEGRLKRCEYGESTGWRYNESYRRGESLSWLTGPLPKLDETCGYMDTSPGVLNMTGYDLKAFVIDWLTREGLVEYSIAEIILTNPRFAHLKEHVGTATIFWSHIQSEPIIDHCKGTLVRIREARESYASQLPARRQQFWWVDYFILRQGIPNDFDLPAIIDVIQNIKIMMCSLEDRKQSVKTYLTRSFCLFEMCTAIDSKATLICYGNRTKRSVLEAQLAPQCPQGWKGLWPEKSWMGSVNAALANTSDPQDKEKIDDHIRSTVGFADIDARITHALLRSAACDIHNKHSCHICPITFFSDACKLHRTPYCVECMSRFDYLGINSIQCKLHKQECCARCYGNTADDSSMTIDSEFIHIQSVSDLINLRVVPTDHQRFRICTEPEIVQALVSGFPHLTALDLQYQTLYANDVETILQSFPRLEYLNLRSGSIFIHEPTKVEDHSARAWERGEGEFGEDDREVSSMATRSAVVFSRALSYGKNLRYLNLQDNKLYEATAALVFQDLPRCCPNLTTLILDDQSLHNTGHSALIAALTGLIELKELSLGNTHLKDALMPQLCTVLATLSHLKQVNVSGNGLSQESVSLLQGIIPNDCVILS